MPGKAALAKWLMEPLVERSKTGSEINVILVSDQRLRALNVEYLNRDYLTDIITFDYSEGNHIAGDLFISLERVRDNARKYNATENQELKRVMIHGILHLLGHKDGNEEEKAFMTKLEDKHLARSPKL